MVGMRKSVAFVLAWCLVVLAVVCAWAEFVELGVPAAGFGMLMWAYGIGRDDEQREQELRQ